MAKVQWSSRLAFIMATMGSAVGLANIWRFPYMAGTGGGAAFILIFLAIIAAVVLPLLIAELYIGRRAAQSPPNALAAIAVESNHSARWRYLGIVGVIAAIMVLAFYSVVGGWCLAYIWRQGIGDLSGISSDASSQAFDGLVQSPTEMVMWASLFLWATVYISARGVVKGVEFANKVLMPLLFVLLLVMVVFSFWVGDARAAARFLFTPDFSKVTTTVVMDAVGQAFFSIGVGATNLMAYGAYMDRRTSILGSSAIVVVAASVVALLSGFAIFPILFAMGLSPSAGPGLTFVTLPYMFGLIPAGYVLGLMFFVLLFAAAITSSISMMEAPVSWLMEKTGWSRERAAITSGSISWALCILCALSFNLLDDVRPLAMFGILENKGFFDLFDFLTTTIVLPLGGLLIAVLAGWIVPSRISQAELGGGIVFTLWRFAVRFIVPIVLGSLFISRLAAG